MEPRGRRGHRAPLPREHGLIALAIGRGSGRRCKWRRERPYAIEHGEKFAPGCSRTVPLSEFAASEYFRRNGLDIRCAHRFAFFARAAGASRVRHQSKPAWSKIFRRARPAPCSRGPYSREGNTRESLNTMQSRGRQTRENRGRRDVRSAPPPVDHQHPWRRDPTAVVARSSPQAGDNRNRREAISYLNFGNALPYGRGSVPPLRPVL